MTPDVISAFYSFYTCFYEALHRIVLHDAVSLMIDVN